ncbi:alpha-L-fucosidase [Coraliomargarita parva]|uniref:alpha-L-fucosidase n=1 Tax=Coraliomargarita parva TaxID=3014050 RepID=UPI0022B3A0E8|nr:alpha-L-fucosidase [Coraliomargarita parva]
MAQLISSLPKPYGAVPSIRHSLWYDIERYAIVHFSVGTFADKEWGFGDEDPRSFNPTDFDANQWAEACLAGGLKGIILVCKHHDGFCLWPTKTTEHSVRNSPWRDGKGDMVAEVSAACRKHGLKFGVYCSPWDRNHPEYGREAYVDIFHEQVRELLNQYGELFEVWFDGANGGNGYYGGTREARAIDPAHYYRWEQITEMIRELQPEAIMFPFDGRWIGNEYGIAGETCWATFSAPNNPVSERPIDLNMGILHAEAWRPAECDFPLRPGWFFHEHEAPKSADTLLDLYFKSIGRGCSINLGLAPDRRGRICDEDIKVLTAWNEDIKKLFSHNLACESSSIFANSSDEKCSASALIDGKPDTFWMPTDNAAPAFTIDFKQAIKFNTIDLSEFVELGQRVEEFAVDIWQDGRWQELATSTSIGYRRLLLTRTTTSDKVRVRFTQTAAAPAISHFGLYRAPASLALGAKITIVRNQQGEVSIRGGGDGLDLRYTTDGSQPTRDSTPYRKPFSLTEGGTVKVSGFVEEEQTGVVTAAYGPARTNWRILSVSLDSPFDNHGLAGVEKLLDDSPDTYWHTYHKNKQLSAPPHEVVIDMAEEREISVVTMTPTTEDTNGIPDRYSFAISSDAEHWQAIAEGEFSNVKANPCQQIIPLKQPAKGRFLKFAVRHVVDNGDYIKVATIDAM